VRTLYRILDDRRLNHRVEVVAGLLASEGAGCCARFLRDFAADAALERLRR